MVEEAAVFSEIALMGPAMFYSAAFTKEELAERFDRRTVETSRDFLVLRTLAEVQKYGATTRRWSAERERHSRAEKFDDLVLSSMELEQAAWTRRLVEALVVLVNFSNTNTNEYFAHYLAVQERERERAAAEDEKDFFGNSSELTRNRLVGLQEKVDVARSCLSEEADCWYLKGSERYRTATLRSQYLRALHLARPAEKTALGYTYRGSFGYASERLHFGVLDSEEGAASKKAEQIEALCGLLCTSIVCRAHDLCGVEPKGINVSLMKTENRDRPVSSLLSARAEVGDFVLISGPHLGEVIEIRRGRFDYESYRLRFLDTRFGPGLEEDWVPAPALSIYMKRADLRRDVLDRIPEYRDRLRLSNEELDEACREAVTEAWQRGVRDYIARLSEEGGNISDA